jgi:hypothetical protein
MTTGWGPAFGPAPGRPRPEAGDEAARVVDELAARQVAARLLGGAGVAAHRHGQVPAGLERPLGDIDLVTGPESGPALADALPALGYTPNGLFNALHGGQRMLFHDTGHSRRLNVFVGEFAMAHRLDLSGRLHHHPRALAPADLLLTTLQIAGLRHDDIVDAARLVLAHEVSVPDRPAAPGQADALSLDRLIEITRADWGWYATVTGNLARVRDAAPALLDQTAAPIVRGRIALMITALDSAPKTASRKSRALAGGRAPWPDLPDEAAGTAAGTGASR